MEITHPDSTTETLSYDDNGQLVRREKYAAGGGRGGSGDGDGDGNGEGNEDSGEEEGGGGVPVEVTGYEWNDQGMLVKVILSNGEPVEYEYDGNQRLISRKSSDGVDNFVQSGWDIVTKMDDLGKRTYYTGMSAVSGAGSSSNSSAMESEDSVKYFHYNHRGDTVLVTDASGEILHNLNYEAYGKPTNNEGIPINTLSLTNATDPGNNTYSTGNTTGGSGNNLPNLFVGASGIRYDTKTDLHYMRFRWFSPSQLRFISPDLLMDLNRYAYVSGNPVRYIDRLGLRETTEGETGTAIWNDPYEYPWYNEKVKWNKAKEFQPADDELKKLISIVKNTIEQYNSDVAKKEHMPDSDVVLCYTWRDVFIKQEFEKKTKKYIWGTQKKNICNIEKLMAADIKKKLKKTYMPKIFPYGKIIGDHTYVYLRVLFPNDKEIWLLTETNATGHDSPGSIHYRTIVVPYPASYPGKPPSASERIIDASKEYYNQIRNIFKSK